MIDFIVKLEMALENSGLDWELRYYPDHNMYALEIDGTTAFMFEKGPVVA